MYKKYGGKTAFFSENIIIEPFKLTDGSNVLTADVHTETGIVRQNIDVICVNEYILASTNHDG
ncbi:MAG: hypothetical protein ACHQF2_09530 [Flavobacteriales bacterium]